MTESRHILDAQGAASLLGAHLETALEIMGRERPDVVLLDLKLSGMDGATVLEKIRARYGSLPVIIVTAYPNSDMMARALEHGPFAMLRKPVESKELLGQACGIDVCASAVAVLPEMSPEESLKLPD